MLFVKIRCSADKRIDSFIKMSGEQIENFDALLAEITEKLHSAEASLERQLEEGAVTPNNAGCGSEGCTCRQLIREEFAPNGRPIHYIMTNQDKCPKWTAYCRLRREIGELKCEEAALLEERRGAKLLAEHYESNPNAGKFKQDCPICMEPIQEGNQTITSCCGAFKCRQCSKDLHSKKSKNNDCAFCRMSREEMNRPGRHEELIEENIAKGHAWALWQKGNMSMDHGWESSQQRIDRYCKALQQYEKAYRSGFTRAAEELTKIFFSLWEEDEKREEWRAKVIEWGNLGVEQGSMANCPLYLSRVCDSDDEAVRLITISAADGFVDSQYELARWHREGMRGLEKSFERGRYWSKKASGQNDPEAFHQLAYMVMDLAESWYNGKPGFLDHDVRSEGIYLLRKAIALGHPTPTAVHEEIQAVQTYEDGQCSNCRCKKMAKDCSGNVLPVKCMRCKFSKYCSLQCLAADWNDRHKHDCCPWPPRNSSS